jgi:hypothetical protein
MSDLIQELQTLGLEWTVATRDDLSDRVLAEIGEVVPRTRNAPRLRRWLVALAAALAAIGISAAVSAPVRAAIVHVFRFGGVEVRPGPGPAPATSPSLPGEHRTTLQAASAEAGFTVRAPSALGPPDRITVSDAHVVSLYYQAGGRPIRIDEFAQDLSMMFEKYTATGTATHVTVGGRDGYWFDDPTITLYLGPDGADPGSARRTDGTLLWVDGGVTYRMDGLRPLSAALAVASSIS